MSSNTGFGFLDQKGLSNVSYDFEQLLRSETAYSIFRHLQEEPDYGASIAKAIGKDSTESVRNFCRAMERVGFLEIPEEEWNKKYYVVDLESTFYLWRHTVIERYVAATPGDGKDSIIKSFEEDAKYAPTSTMYPLFKSWITAYMDNQDTGTLQDMLLDDFARATDLHLLRKGAQCDAYSDAVLEADDRFVQLNTVLRMATIDAGRDLGTVCTAAFDK